MKLFQHQKSGVDFFFKNNGKGAFFWDVGCGKTIAALAAFQRLRQTQPDAKLFIVCPISLIENAWIYDAERYAGLKCCNLREKTDLSSDLLIINYATLISKRFVPTLKQILDLPYKMMVVDESQRIKTHNTKTTKYILSLAPRFRYKMILTATPAPNNNFEYWAQIVFLTPTLFPQNFYGFRNKYFCLKRGESIIRLAGLNRKELQMLAQRGYEIKLQKKRRKHFYKKLAGISQFIKKRDVLDLPEELDELRTVPMTNEQKKAFKDMQKHLVAEIEDEVISVNIALAKLMKLRQISAGFLYNSAKEVIPFKRNPKMKELEAVLSEIGQHKVIIFCQFRWTIQQICQRYPNARDLYAQTKDKSKNIQWFKGADRGYLVAHPLSAGVGLSFNDCDYMVFYSLDYSYMNYYQCRGRIVRANKKNNATFIHLLSEQSLDKPILNALRRKQSNNELFRDAMRALKKI